MGVELLVITGQYRASMIMSQYMSKLFDLSDKVAVVIGATGELGGAIAQAFGEAGAKVAVLGRCAERGQKRVAALKEAGANAEFFQADAMDRDSLIDCEKRITEAFGAPDILLNAAGGNDPKATVTDDNPFVSLPIDAWRQNFDLNLVGGVLLPCQVFGKGMVEKGSGSIINIASVTSHTPLSRVVAYSASKAAVLSLTQFLAREWAEAGVRVNSITPGFFPAEQNKKLLFNEDGSPTPRAESILNHTSMSRFGEAKEIAGAAVFLASQNASSFVTGTDIRVDGGFLSQTI